MCAPTVWLDGSRWNPIAERDSVVDIDALVDPSIIAGIEFYRRATQAPLQWGGTTRDACGVIVLWTRDPRYAGPPKPPSKPKEP